MPRNAQLDRIVAVGKAARVVVAAQLEISRLPIQIEIDAAGGRERKAAEIEKRKALEAARFVEGSLQVEDRIQLAKNVK